MVVFEKRANGATKAHTGKTGKDNSGKAGQGDTGKAGQGSTGKAGEDSGEGPCQREPPVVMTVDETPSEPTRKRARSPDMEPEALVYPSLPSGLERAGGPAGLRELIDSFLSEEGRVLHRAPVAVTEADAQSVRDQQTIRTVAESVAAAMANARPMAITQLEERATANDRNLRNNMQEMIGTAEEPHVGGALFDAIRGRATAAPLREVVRQIRASSIEHDAFIQLFADAGCKVTPLALTGDDTTSEIARWGARIVLRDLGDKFAEQLLISEGYLMKQVNETMQALRGAVSDSRNTTTARALVMAGSGSGTRQPAPAAAPAPQQQGRSSVPPRPMVGPSNTMCFVCGKVGHMRFQCPNNRK